MTTTLTTPTPKPLPQLEQARALFTDMRDLLLRYFAFTDARFASVLACWAMATHCLKSFDSFGYVVITAFLKRCGKSRLGDTLAYLSKSPEPFTAMTKATAFAVIDEYGDDGCCMLFDECEELASETHDMRPVLNSGAERGTLVPRMREGKVVRFCVFGPKIFILIGDVFDTLKDRSILIRMARATNLKALAPYIKSLVRKEAAALGERMDGIAAVWQGKERVRPVMMDTLLTTEYLDSRALDMWLPVLTMARMLDLPGLADAVSAVACDLEFEKTADKRTAAKLEHREAEQTNADFAERLLRDCASLAKTHGHLFSKANGAPSLLDYLYQIPTSGWSKYKGTGLTATDCTAMLTQMGVKAKAINDGGKTRWGYRAEAILKALAVIDEPTDQAKG